MATDWANALDWGSGGGFRLPSEAEIAQSRANWDDFYSMTGKFAPQGQNIDLLRQLGFGGSAVDQQAGEYGFGGGTPRWSNEALQWLDGQGYSVGVGHQPGTKSGGRPEFWGLMGPDGKYVQGQSDPTMSMSDTMMDQLTPFLLMAGPLAAAAGVGSTTIGAVGGGLSGAANAHDTGGNLLTGALKGAVMGGAGAWAGGQLMGSLDGVSMADFGNGTAFDKIGQNLSDSFGTLYDQGSSLFSGGGLSAGSPMATASLDRVVSTGVSGAMPDFTGLGGVIPAMTGAPSMGGLPQLDRVETQGQSAPWTPNLSGLLGGGAGFTGAPASSLDRVEVTGTASPRPVQDLLPSLVGTGGLLGQPTPTAGLDRVEVSGPRAEEPRASIPPLMQNLPQASYSHEGNNYTGPNGHPTSQAPTHTSPDTPFIDVNGSGMPEWMKAIGGGVGKVAELVGGGKNLAALIGAGLGAASGGGTRTSSEEPWIDAQPFLRNVLGDADNMLTQFRQNPLTAQQNTQFQHAFSGLDHARGALPGLLNWGQNAMQRQSTTPSYEQLFGGGQSMQPVQPMPGGLLTQQPTAQAGGPGGLLGNDPQDRFKALMARGRGLLG